ncbi:AGAP005643-PA-like protein [Anopheles sinensis]|uniref:AGAP005643-PA-like protein n=1 Tax=Anopheles sinensis TaxID=74873 RepID=A0A084WK63_ANOSI|nr:AGAP005643-PA-like protein [Anopheles sinensis]
MDSVDNAQPEEAGTDDVSDDATQPVDEIPLASNSVLPLVGMGAQATISGDFINRNVVIDLVDPQPNMEIELDQLQASVFQPQPVIFVDNYVVPEGPLDGSPDATGDEESADSVPVVVATPPAAQPTDNDATEPPVVDSTRASTRSSPDSTPRRRKRRRTFTPKKVDSPKPPKPDDEDDDDGIICSICFSEWTMTGDHRVVALKCGHLFGMSCIKRWLQDNPASVRCCATCKAKAKLSDIRFIYARAIKAIDNTRETELTKELEGEKKKSSDLQLKLFITQKELEDLRKEAKQIRSMIETMRQPYVESQEVSRRYSYHLTLEKNLLINNEPGCRVMVYSYQHKLLLISQKSNLNLFPGYAVRLLHLPELARMSMGPVIHVSTKQVRDIALDELGNQFACATMENNVKVFSLVTRAVSCSITLGADSIIWSCAFDRGRPYILYLGTQRGEVFRYDIRNPNQPLGMHAVGHEIVEYTAVIQICPVEPTSAIPFGGFLVCKLKSAWFFEYTTEQGQDTVTGYRLNVSPGTLSSMSYNPDSGHVLISVRPTQAEPSTHLLAELVKKEGAFLLHKLHAWQGSRLQKTIQRSAQVFMNKSDTLVLAYQEDNKVLTSWCSNSKTVGQHLPLAETVYDICATVSTTGRMYLAALSDNRCRIYCVNQSVLE